jgi:uncharacterized protein
MRVIDVGLDPEVGQPVLVLGEIDAPHRVLPIWIGAPEAEAIELARRGESTPRPLTHQLVGRILEATSRRLEQVRLTEVLANQVHAELAFDRAGVVSCRASDGVAIALDVRVPIVATESLLEQAGLRNVRITNADRPDTGSASETEAIEEFREFLDDVSPEDFDTER